MSHLLIPRKCDGDDCPDGWHIASYAHDENGEPCDSLPNDDEIAAANADYFEHVAITGKDPLSLFAIERDYRRSAVWQIRAVAGSAGIRVSVRRNGRGRWLHRREIPAYVQEFLCLNHAGKMHDGISDLSTLVKQARGVRWGKPGRHSHIVRIGWVRIEERVHRKNSAIRRDLRRAARSLYRELCAI